MAKLLNEFKHLVTKSGKSYKQAIAKSDGRAFWKSGAIVIYKIDVGRTETEEFDSGEVITNFSPTKDGYVFVGWRENNTPAKQVLPETVMGSEAITLYAVFSKSIKLTCYEIDGTKVETPGTQYYNNGITDDPLFSLDLSYKAGWEELGWSSTKQASSSVQYDPVVPSLKLVESTTLYGVYHKDVTLSYNGNGAVSGSVAPETKKAYWNASGEASYPEFKLKENGFSGGFYYAFNGWDLGSVGAKVTLSENKTAYAQWRLLAVPYTISSGWSDREWTVLRNDNTDHHEYWLYDASVELKARNHGNTGMEGVTLSTPLNTQKCNRMKITYHSTNIANDIMGSPVPNLWDGYVVKEISGDTVNLTLAANVPGLYSGASEGDESYLTMYSVEFYYEE